MVERGTIGRFARWGLTHGPTWGMAAAVLSGLVLSRRFDLPVGWLGLVAAGLVTGLVGGPLLGVLVGMFCVAADHVPRWILDAPDYVAAVTVVATVTSIALPVLHVADTDLAMGGLGVVLLAVTPAVDAARNAPSLLHPSTQRDGRP